MTREDAAAQELCEKVYCARGDMENRIKECQLDLLADRTSAATLRAKQLQLWFSSLAYVLVTALRRRAQGHEASSNCWNDPFQSWEARRMQPARSARH